MKIHLHSAPTRLVIAGGMELADRGRVFAALDAVHAEQHLSEIVLLAPNGPSGPSATHGLVRRWAERSRVPVKTWLFVPARAALDRWLAFECQADVVLRVPGPDYGLLSAARRVGLTVLAADGRTPVAALAPRRQTRRFFPPWQRPGRALRAA